LSTEDKRILLSKRTSAHNRSSREERAQQVLDSSGVKVHKFYPSGREIWTVLGRDGDLIVDISEIRAPYCSCDDFYFRVQSGEVSECYHLIAAKRAKETGAFATVVFSDEEYQSFLMALVIDVFSRID
jgi:predicted nucleic acid-binding Zn finger protein